MKGGMYVVKKKKKSSGVVLVPNYVWRLSGFVGEG